MTTVVTKDQYFEFALGVLATSGSGGLNIGVLCRGLGVTSGSFYHHFGNWQGFVEALLGFWANRQVTFLKEVRFGTGSSEADVEKLRDLAVNLHHSAEAAIRAWGANEERVRDALLRVDESRRKTVRKAIRGVIADPEVATLLASLGMSILVGYQQLSASGQGGNIAELLDEFVRLIYLHAISAPGRVVRPAAEQASGR
ncbi:TetR/AcrR family transcriptional regulator [Mycobacteroides abscessus]|uniref:TetR/AcrR family transcriptional regulator n=1 Tax=Mycobacteroides abscessus TaxID=36809 RepID=UPI003AF9D10D